MNLLILTYWMLTSLSVQAAPATPDECYGNLAKTEYQALFPSTTPRSPHLVDGINFTCSDEECDFVERVLGSTPPSLLSSAAEQCSPKTALCVLTKVLGSEESAEIILTTLKRNGYALSVGQEKNAGNPEVIWQLNDLRLLNNILRVLPPELNHLDQVFYGVKTFYRNSGASGNTLADNDLSGTITFFDSSFSTDTMEIYKTIVHEIAHSLDAQGMNDSHSDPTDLKNYSDQKDYGFYQYSWEKYSPFPNTLFTRPREGAFPDTFITFYAGSGRRKAPEDFAETVSYYVVEPAKLKTLKTLPPPNGEVYRSPSKFEFMKQFVFHGADFGSINLNPCASLDKPSNPSPLESP